jgi:hypothetical protein
MSRWASAVGGLMLVVALSGCSRLDVFHVAAQTTGVSVSTSAPASSSAAPATAHSSAPTSTAARSTPQEYVLPPPAPEAPPIPPPTVYRGAGDGVLTISKPAGTTAVIATVVGNAEARNFDVRAIDGAQDHLVTTTSPYTGSTLLDADGTTTRQLRVHAVGAWTITLTDPRSAPVFSLGYSGSGDAVVLHSGTGGQAVINAANAGSVLLVRTYSAGRVNDIVKQPGPWSGTVPWPAGPSIVVVRAVGPWSITVDRRQ